MSAADLAAKHLVETCTAPQLDVLALQLDLQVDDTLQGAPTATRVKRLWDLVRQRGGTALADLEESATALQGRPTPLYWLYLSCAESDRGDPLCNLFYQDLTERLRKLDPTLAGELRYLDLGDPADPQVWSPWSLRALQSCQVLVCLYSREYFASSYCGRVWAAFARRRAGQRLDPAEPSPGLILPVQWQPAVDNPAILPLVARDLGEPQGDIEPLDRERGLRFFVQQVHARRDEYRGAYEDFLTRFAGHLLAAAAARPLNTERHIPPLGQIESAFYTPFEGPRSNRQKGAEYARFVYVAARQTEIAPLRQADAYGETAECWCPFHPTVTLKLGALCSEAAGQVNMIPGSIALDDSRARQLRAADENGNVTVVLVDPWTLQLDHYGRLLLGYDESDLRNGTVLVCWNEDDKATAAHRRHLASTLARIFERKRRAAFLGRFRDDIGTVADLRSELFEALLQTRREVIDAAAEPREVTGPAFVRPLDLGTMSPPPGGDEHDESRRAELPGKPPIRQPRLQGPSL